MDAPSQAAQAVLFRRDWPTTGLAKAISDIDRNDLSREYGELKRRAPRRHAVPKEYFRGHEGRLSPRSETTGGSNRFEEHLAIALWRMWRRPGMGRVRLLDYQVPLKAGQGDKGIGKVDLLGVTDCGRLKVIELKVKPEEDTARGENPMVAVMEGLRYAAIVDANRAAIVEEARYLFDEEISKEPPIVQILAPKAWWRGWLELAGSTRAAAGGWEPEFVRLVRDVEERLGIVVECTALDDVQRADIDYGSDGRQPRINRTLALYPVRPGEAPAIGPALPAPQNRG